MDTKLLIILLIFLAVIFFIILCLTAYAERKRHGGLVNIGIWALSAIVSFVGFGLLYKEKVTLSDMVLVYNINISSIGFDCTIIPQTNVQKLELEFEFFDSSNRKIFTLKKNIGNVKKNQIYTLTISLFEINTSTIPITCNMKISNGYINGFTKLSQAFNTALI